MTTYHDDAKIIKQALRGRVLKKDVPKRTLNYQYGRSYDTVLEYAQRTVHIAPDGGVWIYAFDTAHRQFVFMPTDYHLRGGYPCGVYDGKIWHEYVRLTDPDTLEVTEVEAGLQFRDQYSTATLYRVAPKSAWEDLFIS